VAGLGKKVKAEGDMAFMGYSLFYISVVLATGFLVSFTTHKLALI
jgi:hypothetical protein